MFMKYLKELKAYSHVVFFADLKHYHIFLSTKNCDANNKINYGNVGQVRF